MSDETRINGKVWKTIQAGQDWKDPETWYGLLLAIGVLVFIIVGHYFDWWHKWM